MLFPVGQVVMKAQSRRSGLRVIGQKNCKPYKSFCNPGI